MRFTLRQLEVFLAVARVESVSRAAAALGMSQSAASGSLSDLERQFGIQLFDRRGKRLQLSELGRSVRADCEKPFWNPRRRLPRRSLDARMGRSCCDTRLRGFSSAA